MTNFIFVCPPACRPQLPNFSDLSVVSLLGAVMSIGYCTIAVAMAATVRPGPEVQYDPGTVPRGQLERIMGVFNALTTILFAYGA